DDGALCGATDGNAVGWVERSETHGCFRPEPMGFACPQPIPRHLTEAEMAEPRRRAKKSEADLRGARILIVEARFYDDIADALLAGAVLWCEDACVGFDRITVPGSLEIPAAGAMALGAGVHGKRPYVR